MLNNVAVVLLDGVHPFELGVVCEVFGLDRSDQGLPVYDFAVVSAEGPTLRTQRRASRVTTAHGLDRLEEADLIAVPAGSDVRDPGLPARAARRAAPGAWTGAPGCSASAPACSCSPPPDSSTGGAAPRTGGTPTNSPGGIRAATSSRTCCTSTRAR